MTAATEPVTVEQYIAEGGTALYWRIDAPAPVRERLDLSPLPDCGPLDPMRDFRAWLER